MLAMLRLLGSGGRRCTGCGSASTSPSRPQGDRRHDRRPRAIWPGRWPRSSASPTTCSRARWRPTSGGTARAAPAASPARRSRSRRASPSWPSSSRWRTAWAASTRPGLAERRSGKQFDPASCDVSRRRREGLRRPRRPCIVGCGHRRRAGARPGFTDRVRRRAAAIAHFVDLKSPYTLGHSTRRRPRRRRRRRSVCRGTRCACAGPGWWLVSVGSASRTRSGTSRARSRQVSGSGSRSTRSTPNGCSTAPHALAPLGRHRRPDPRAARRLGLPGGPRRPAISRPAASSATADAFQSMSEPRPHRPALSIDEAAAVARATSGRPPRRRGRRRRPRRGRPTGQPPARGPAGLTAREVEVLQSSPGDCRTRRSPSAL